MKINLLCVANKAPNWIDIGCQEYIKRINRGRYQCKLIVIKADRKANRSTIENMQIEAKKFIQYIPESDYLAIFDERGSSYDSTEFAKLLEKASQNFGTINLIIGGDSGVHPELKKQANELISLSRMVFPHHLVQLIALEQIYRATSILENHPYHRS